MKAVRHIPTIILSYLVYLWMPEVTWYQISTSAVGIYDLLNLPAAEGAAAATAYEYMIDMSNVANTSVTDVETEHVRAYYNVINRMLAVADIEKLYIPPQLDAKKGLYQNQFLVEKQVFDMLGAKMPIGADSNLLDMGCGRGRISQHAARASGAKVQGYNIDDSQVQNAIEYAEATGMSERLDFRVGDHHKPLPYPDASFDGAFSFQAVWPFFKAGELDQIVRELWRVLKPGARYSCSEYLLTPEFDPTDAEHMALHKLFLPTLAATQSRYPAEVTQAFERAGFQIVMSAPSKAPAWPLTDQKTDLFLFMRSIVMGLAKFGLVPAWVTQCIDNLLKGGVAWAEAEKMKIADLNWRITVEKPL